MEFREFSSIENTYRTAFIEKVGLYGLDKDDFIVTEKIHGANFSIWFDLTSEPATVKFAKRTGWLEPGEKFYDYQLAVSSLEQAMDSIKKQCTGHEIVVYGELFGGHYNHPDVKKATCGAVQKGVQYHPNQQFCAFDLKIDGRYVDHDTFVDFCGNMKIPTVPILFRGSFDQCLKYPNFFESRVHQVYNLPQVLNNMCEGVVIKPVQPLFFPNGERVMLKNKNEQFAEKSHKKSIDVPKEIEQIDPVINEHISIISEYINDNRLRNVLSKLGTVTDKDFGKLMIAFTKDVFDDYNKEHDTTVLSKEQNKAVSKHVGQSSSQLIRKSFLNIIDGKF